MTAGGVELRLPKLRIKWQKDNTALYFLIGSIGNKVSPTHENQFKSEENLIHFSPPLQISIFLDKQLPSIDATAPCP